MRESRGGNRNLFDVFKRKHDAGRKSGCKFFGRKNEIRKRGL